eukprot:GEZU01001317.1.p1 GENE.GEZU01001317.1~~GEZU01001317.1.p1  ORF type:complete len:345 (-),score=38.41 GEZU01001317.1:15-938(-)
MLQYNHNNPAPAAHVLPVKQRQQQKQSEFSDLCSAIGLQLYAFLRKWTTVSGRGNAEAEQQKQKQPKYQSPQMVAQEIANFLSRQQQQQPDQLIASTSVTQNGFINFVLTQEGRVQYQQQSHGNNTSTATRSNNNSTMPTGTANSSAAGQKRKLQITLMPSLFTEESYALYRKYQIAVHKENPDEITEKSFKDFLVDTPLLRCEADNNRDAQFQIGDEIPELKGLCDVTCKGFQGYGSFHVHYRIDGRLFMVAVIDVLPSCLSSVYVYYDPEFLGLSPGIYSALSEILWVKCVSKIKPKLHYYYLAH